MTLIGESMGPVALHTCNVGHPLALPYVLSDTLPPKAVHKIQIEVESFDEGCCNAHEYSCGTWFEMSVLRRAAGTQIEPLRSHSGALDMRKINRLYARPAEYADDFASQGWAFVPVPAGRFVCRHVDVMLENESEEEEERAAEQDFSICIFHNAVHRDWIFSTRAFLNGGPRWFEEGDRLVIWVNTAVSKDSIILFRKSKEAWEANLEKFANRENLVRRAVISYDSSVSRVSLGNCVGIFI